MIPIDKVVILAGGKGTRIIEESYHKPKPLIEIGGIPILLHIMSIYSYYGINDFVILTGYKSLEIKKFFINDIYRNTDLKISYSDKNINFLKKNKRNWKVNLIETGEETMTGGRLLSAEKYIGDKDFFLTYGDCISDIDLNKLYTNHKSNNKIATVTGILQKNRFGSISLDKKGEVLAFAEKPKESDTLISGGFFLLKKHIFKFLKNSQTIFEKEPLSSLAEKKQLNCYHHKGFWHPMDNLRDKNHLEDLWNSGKAPWKKFIKKSI